MGIPTISEGAKNEISRWFTVDEVVVRDPDGSTSVWHFQNHPGAVVVVAVTESGQVAVVREWRPAVGHSCVELPSGRIDPGEEPEQAAARELFEETGLTAAALVPLGSVYNSPGSSNETTHMFYTAVAASHTLEVANASFMAASTFDDAFRHGDVCDATSVLAIELARRMGLLAA